MPATRIIIIIIVRFATEHETHAPRIRSSCPDRSTRTEREKKKNWYPKSHSRRFSRPDARARRPANIVVGRFFRFSPFVSAPNYTATTISGRAAPVVPTATTTMIISKDLFLLGDQDYLRLPKDDKRSRNANKSARSVSVD